MIIPFNCGQPQYAAKFMCLTRMREYSTMLHGLFGMHELPVSGNQHLGKSNWTHI